MDAKKIVKGLLGVAVVAVLSLTVMNWIGDYRASTGSTAKSPGETTASVTPTNSAGATATPAAPQGAGAQVLIVQVEGLNFRQKPSGTSKAYRGLAQGEKVVVISKEGEWYKVRDSGGTVGYITSNPSYTKPAQ